MSYETESDVDFLTRMLEFAKGDKTNVATITKRDLTRLLIIARKASVPTVVRRERIIRMFELTEPASTTPPSKFNRRLARVKSDLQRACFDVYYHRATTDPMLELCREAEELLDEYEAMEAATDRESPI